MLASDTDCSGVLIDCGGPGDAGFSGGQVVDRGKIEIYGTDRPTLYRTERWGLNSYALRLKPGTYDVTVGFAETYDGVKRSGARVFGLRVGGIDLGKVDVFREVGWRRALVKHAFGVVVGESGELVVEFARDKGDPMVNFIEVTLPGVLDRPEPDEPEEPDEPDQPDEPDEPDLPPVEPRPGIQPPAHARAAGLTKLIFEEDFLDSSRLSRDTKLKPGQTFCCLGPGNPVWGASVLPANAIRFEDGRVELAPNNTNFQGDIISSAGLNNGFLLRGNRWCVEIRWKHPRKSASKGFPAFWSMDARHWYTNKGGPKNSEYMEPDFYEFIGGRHIGALHYWRAIPRGRPEPMQQVSGGALPDVTKFFTAGAMIVPGEYSWYVNNRKMGGKSPSWLDRMMSDFRGPLIIGSGPEFPLVIDWVRVWGEP